MSIATLTPSTSTTEALPNVTADIDVALDGTLILRVTIDGERIGFRIDQHLTRLHEQTVTEEAERLLQRHAGYKPASDWTTDERGHLTAPVAEITGRCITCIHGCGCSIDSTGCAHYCCPAASPETANTCAGAALAVNAKRPPLRRRRNRR